MLGQGISDPELFPPSPKPGASHWRGTREECLSWPPLPPSFLVVSWELGAYRSWSNLSTELLSALQPKQGPTFLHHPVLA